MDDVIDAKVDVEGLKSSVQMPQPHHTLGTSLFYYFAGCHLELIIWNKI